MTMMDDGTGGSTPAPLTDEQLVYIASSLTPLIADAMNQAILTAVASTPVPVIRPGTVSGFNPSTVTATVLIDGDTAPTDAQVAGEWPVPGDRVLLVFAPPAAVWVFSILGHGGVPPGSCIAYLGPISVDTPGAAAASAPPPGFARPYGQLSTQGQHPGLFYAVGSTYNTGGEDPQLGQFRFPDCRGRIFIGLDNMGGSDAGVHSIANTVGTKSGAETHTLAENQLPSHAHSLSGSFGFSGTTGGGGNHTHSDSGHGHSDSGHTHPDGWGGSYLLANDGSALPAAGSDGIANTGTGYANIGTGYANLGYPGDHTHGFSGSVTLSGNTGYAGSGNSVNHMPPVMVCSWIVKL